MPSTAPNVRMEIIRREDMGADLKAPSAARGGGVTASYVLVPAVRPGDVVIHYDSRHEDIVGVSMAAGSAVPTPIYWVARGSYARRAGAQPHWLPGLRVALDRYREVAPPVTIAEIRGHRDQLLALRRRIQDRAGGRAIYFPWIPYQDTLRTFQSYLVKMPRDAVSLFPRLRALVDETTAGPPAGAAPSAADQVADAAGKVARRGGGQASSWTSGPRWQSKPAR